MDLYNYFVKRYEQLDEDLFISDIVLKGIIQSQKRVIVIAPTKEELTGIFNKIRLNLYRNIESLIQRDVSNPHQCIGLRNNTELRGFALVDKYCTCGQDADYIYLYNLNNLSQELLETCILPIKYSCEDCQLYFYIK